MKRGLQYKLLWLVAVALLLVAPLAGCGGSGSSDSYDTPVSTQTETPLISAATLKGWMDAGLVDGTAYGEKVVILDYETPMENDTTGEATIEAKRIKGACRASVNELRDIRFEAIAPAASMVPSGAMMDALIQRFGIDEDTTIVFTTGNSYMFYATRAYWTFRYWGFPKEKLKVLDGGNKAFFAAYPELSTYQVNTPTPSTFSVVDNGELRSDLRASLGEMIAAVKVNGLTTLTIDARGGAATSSYAGNAGASKGYIDATLGTGSTKVVFEGHPEYGVALGQGTLFNADGTFKSAEDIRDIFEDVGWDETVTAYVYCLSGYSATPLFFALDAILDEDVVLYDGSWSQWGKMSADAAKGGMLPAGSPWATDVLSVTDAYGTAVTYNMDSAYSIETLSVDTAKHGSYMGTDDPEANTIENEDASYMSGGSSSASSDAPTAGGGGTSVGC